MVFLHLKRICSATENESLSPLKTLLFCSLYLMPHIKNRSPPYKKWSLGSYGGSLPYGLPPKPSASGFGGRRTSDRTSELSRLRESEECVVRSDDSEHRL